MSESRQTPMRPTLSLRWLSTRYNVTLAMAMAYREAHDVTLIVAKKRLEDATGPVLQQWFDARIDGHPEDEQGTGEWRDIPCVLQKISVD